LGEIHPICVRLDQAIKLSSVEMLEK